MTRIVKFPLDAMQNIVESFPGRIGFVAHDVLTGANYAYNEHDLFPTASVCKIPVMIELYRQVEAGQIRLDDRYKLHSGICTEGTGSLKDVDENHEMTLRAYCQLMIGVSDNMATDIISEAVGLENINPTMDQLGYPHTRVNMSMGRWHYHAAGLGQAPINRANDAEAIDRVKAGQLDFDAVSFAASLQNNVITALDFSDMLKQMLRGTLISASASSDMIDMLKRVNYHRRMIPRHLNDNIEVAHKVGQSERIRCDGGIVYLSQGPMIVVGLTFAEEVGDRRPGIDAIAQLSRLAISAIDAKAIVSPSI